MRLGRWALAALGILELSSWRFEGAKRVLREHFSKASLAERCALALSIVDEIEAALEHVRSKGCIVLSKPVPATAFAGKRIAWFYTPTRQLVELVER